MKQCFTWNEIGSSDNDAFFCLFLFLTDLSLSCPLFLQCCMVEYWLWAMAFWRCDRFYVFWCFWWWALSSAWANHSFSYIRHSALPFFIPACIDSRGAGLKPNQITRSFQMSAFLPDQRVEHSIFVPWLLPGGSVFFLPCITSMRGDLILDALALDLDIVGYTPTFLGELPTYP